MQEVTSLNQILPLVAAGASVLLALGAVVFSGIFFYMSTRRISRAQGAAGQIENSTKQLSRLYERMYRDSMAKKQDSVGGATVLGNPPISPFFITGDRTGLGSPKISNFSKAQ